jgi:hypothetical protein
LPKSIVVLFSAPLWIAIVTFSSNVEGEISEEGIITVVFSGIMPKLLAIVSSIAVSIVSLVLCNSGSTGF